MTKYKFVGTASTIGKDNQGFQIEINIGQLKEAILSEETADAKFKTGKGNKYIKLVAWPNEKLENATHGVRVWTKSEPKPETQTKDDEWW